MSPPSSKPPFHLLFPLILQKFCCSMRRESSHLLPPQALAMGKDFSPKFLHVSTFFITISPSFSSWLLHPLILLQRILKGITSTLIQLHLISRKDHPKLQDSILQGKDFIFAHFSSIQHFPLVCSPTSLHVLFSTSNLFLLASLNLL